MSKKQVFYIHGGSAFSRYEDYINHLKTSELRFPHGDKPELWSKKLRQELGEDYEVFTPAMPNSQNSKYQEWKIWFERHFEFLHDDLCLVGWSQGALFLIKYLSENDLPLRISRLILIASPSFYFKDPSSGEDGGDFNLDSSKLSELANRADSIHLMHSKDDFVVPFEHALKLKEALPEAELVVFEDRNHFLQENFPELIGLIIDKA